MGPRAREPVSGLLRDPGLLDTSAGVRKRADNLRGETMHGGAPADGGVAAAEDEHRGLVLDDLHDFGVDRLSLLSVGLDATFVEQPIKVGVVEESTQLP